jgi:hypothetical protein
MARAPWPKALKSAAIAVYFAMAASFSMLYMIYSMPDWLTTVQRMPGAAATRELTDTAQGLEVLGWCGVLGTAAVLAVLFLGALVTPHRLGSGARQATRGGDLGQQIDTPLKG